MKNSDSEEELRYTDVKKKFSITHF